MVKIVLHNTFSSPLESKKGKEVAFYSSSDSTKLIWYYRYLYRFAFGGVRTELSSSMLLKKQLFIRFLKERRGLLSKQSSALSNFDFRLRPGVWVYSRKKIKKSDGNDMKWVFINFPYKKSRLTRIKVRKSSWRLLITKTRRNVFFVISAASAVKYWACIARLGFKKAQRRINKQSSKRLLDYIMLFLKKHNVAAVNIVFRGVGSVLLWTVKTLRLRGVHVDTISNDCLLPRNGVKCKKSRRV